MKNTNKSEWFELSSGKLFEANGAIIGINPDLEVYEGYDSGLSNTPLFENLTKEEKIEIADFMVDLWNQWKEK